MVVTHQKREHEGVVECVFYVTSYVTILSFIKCGRHERNKSMRWHPERSAGKQIMRPRLAQQRAAITVYLATGQGISVWLTAREWLWIRNRTR